MTLSREAIEAAAEALWQVERRYYNHRDMVRSVELIRKQAEAALTAALPHLLPQPTASDEERAANLEKYGRYSTKGDSDEMKAIYLRALAAIRAEATLAATMAERERCERAAQPFVLAAAGSEHELGCNYAATEIVAAIRRTE